MLWKNAYETGNAIVDGQHKELFRLVQQVMDADGFANRKEKIEAAMSFLSDYAVRHFTSEERLMQRCSYPEFAEHKAQHNGFVKSVYAFVARFEEEGDTISISETINNFVLAWLQGHIMVTDRLMAEYYKEWEASR